MNPRALVFGAFFFALLAALLALTWKIFLPFLPGMTWALIIAFVFHPLQRAGVRRLRRPNLVAFLVTGSIYLVVILPLVTISGLLIVEARGFYDVLSRMAESGELSRMIDGIRSRVPVAMIEALVPPEVAANVDLPSYAVRAGQMASNAVVGSLGGIARNVLDASIQFTIMILTLFFFLRDGESLVDAFRSVLPMEGAHQERILGRFHDTVSAVVLSMTVTAGAQGLLTGLALAILGVPFSVLLGVAAGFASFVPMGGPALVWLPAAAWLAYSGNWVQAIVLVVWGTVVVGLVDNVLKPWIIGDRAEIPTIFLLFSILGGLQAFGVLGVFLGPTLLAVLLASLKIYRDEFLTSTAAG